MATGDNPFYHSKEYPDYMKKLSSLAINFNTYLVTNIVEKVKCDNTSSSASENCKNTGNYYYNTNVVFDRNGTIISRFVVLVRRTNNSFVDFRYHKFNLFGDEHLTDRTDLPEIETFETDFGVKFGIFTCFDILFQYPAEILLNANIDAIIYPTNWRSELPFLTGLLVRRHELFLKSSLQLFKVSRCSLTPTTLCCLLLVETYH